MPLTITLSPKLKKLFNANSKSGLVSQVRKEFSKRGPIKVKQAIVQDMIKGVSPVKGKGKWKRYSKSYKDQIKGKVRFFTSGGVVVAIKAKRGKRISNNVTKSASPTKQISPVNLRLTGELHRDLKVFTSGGFLRSFRLVARFKNKLADIHNRRGAGKSKVVRRLLPTKNGEQFNKRITTVILAQMKKAADMVVSKFNGS